VSPLLPASRQCGCVNSTRIELMFRTVPTPATHTCHGSPWLARRRSRITASPLQLMPCLPAVTEGAGYEPSGFTTLADATTVYYATTRTVCVRTAAVACRVRALPRCAAIATSSPTNCWW
jgi:hypothetical protein